MRLERACAQVIEKKQRLGPEYSDVVDAVVHEVFADCVMLIHGEGQLELGAHAIDRAHENRLFVLLEVESKEPAEPANLAHHLFAVRGGQ